tara:strand:+ start:370 stop:474 length:105 start_codon:yes stop_codon:yes gene_type:complete
MMIVGCLLQDTAVFRRRGGPLGVDGGGVEREISR